MKRSQMIWGLPAVLTAAGLLWQTEAVSAGVRAGLTSCAGILIPSLFPFMILAGMIVSTRAGAGLSHAVSAVTRRITGLPEELGAVLLMSFIGGFPVGARMLAALLERREIDRETTERALCFCVNAGPSFLISAVGAGMLGSRNAGLLLLAAQFLSAMLISAFLFHGFTPSAPAAPPAPQNRHGTFVLAVQSASAGILSICAFVVAFSAITALLRALGVLDFLAGLLGGLFPSVGTSFFTAALAGILEVTNGCMLAAGLHNHAGFLLSAFLVSFSSLSILFQVKSCFPADAGIRFGRFYGSRLAHGGLTVLFAALFYRFLPPAELTAAALSGTPVPRATPDMFVTSLCLICMCSILLMKAETGKANVKN